MVETGLDGAAAEAVLEALPVGLWMTDEADRVCWVNPSLCLLLDAEAEQLLGATGTELAHQAGSRGRVERVGLPAAGEADRKLLLCCLVPVQDAGAERAAGAGRPVRERLDPLSGLLTRTAALEELSAQVSRSRRYGNRLSLVLLDAGSPQPQTPPYPPQALKAIGGLLRDKLRWVDRAAYWAPWRFLLILPETPAADAAVLGRQLCERLRAPGSAASDLPEGMEFSVKVAEWQPGDDVFGLLRRAGADGPSP